MSLRSIDLQVALPKVQEVGQSYRHPNQQDLNQQQFAAQFNKEVDRQQQQVRSSPKSEGTRVKKDGSHRRDNQDSARGQDRQPGSEDEHRPKEPGLGHNIDIRI